MIAPHRIVLSGGPCAGKSSSLAKLSEWLENLGFRVYQVPEAASLLFNGSARRDDLVNKFYGFNFQQQLMKSQMALEKMFYNLALDIGKPAILLCDRGLMDGKAFIGNELWQKILDENGWTEVGLRDKHYDAVIHLVSAAIGAENHYTLDNNKARTESVEDAARIDRALQAAWTGHPHLRVIDNSTDFEGKVKRVLQAVCRVIGVPEPLEIEKKFIVSVIGDLPKEAQTFDISQAYYVDKNGKDFRLRSRGAKGSNVYFYTEKKTLGPGTRIEIERKISAREALEIEHDATLLGKLTKKRTCFLYDGFYYELDEFKTPENVCGLKYLEIELDDINQPYTMPPFIKVEREVTDDPAASNKWIALNQK